MESINNKRRSDGLDSLTRDINGNDTVDQAKVRYLLVSFVVAWSTNQKGSKGSKSWGNWWKR